MDIIMITMFILIWIIWILIIVRLTTIWEDQNGKDALNAMIWDRDLIIKEQRKTIKKNEEAIAKLNAEVCEEIEDWIRLIDENNKLKAKRKPGRPRKNTTNKK